MFVINYLKKKNFYDYLLVIFLSFLIFFIASYSSRDTSWTDFPAWKNDGENILKFFRNINNPEITSSIYFSKHPIGYGIVGYFVKILSFFNFSNGDALRIINSLFLTIPIFAIISTSLDSHIKKIWILFYGLLMSLSAISLVYIHSGALEVIQGSLISSYIISRFFYNKNEEKSKNNLLIIRFTTLLSAALLKDTLIVSILFSEGLFIIKSNLVFKNQKLFSNFSKNIHINNLKSKISLCDFSALTLGISISIFWNLIRYKSILPISYLNESNTIKVTRSDYIQNFLAGIFSPNGGLIFFYGINIFIVVLVFLKIKELRNTIKKEKLFVFIKFSEISIYSTSVIFTALLINSKWWAAFGWVSWGNRLIIPWSMSLIISASLGLITFLNIFDSSQELIFLDLNTNKFKILKNKISFINRKFFILISRLAIICGIYYFISSVNMSNYKISSRIEISGRCQNFYEQIYKNRNQYSPEQEIYNTKEFKLCVRDRFWKLKLP